jgi:hypothetical protein
MKSIRILRSVILLLVCTNLLLLYKLYSKPKHPPRLSHIVKAEGALAKTLDKEMHRHHRAVVKWTQRQFELRQKLVHSQPKNEHSRSVLLDQISRCQRNIDSITIAHFDRVSELCTPAQEERFRKFRTQILQPPHLQR